MWTLTLVIVGATPILVGPWFPSDGGPSHLQVHASVIAPQAATGLWTLLGTSAPPRYGAGFAFDAKADRFIQFGGIEPVFQYRNSTWTFDLTTHLWANVTPAVGPSVRAGMGMVYDPKADRVVLFGGTYFGSGLNDTWIFDLGNDTWTQRFPNPAPQGRAGAGMAYDSAADRVILYGGGFTDTWAYDVGTNVWTRRNATLMGAYTFTAMAYDTAADRTILFGGFENNTVATAATWAYNYGADAWTNLAPSVQPAARGGEGLAYDSVADQTILFGGGNSHTFNTGAVFGDTWTYDAITNTWANVTPSLSPPARILPGMAYSAAANRVVLSGGVAINNTAYADAWSFDLGGAPPSAPQGLLASAGQHLVDLSWLAPLSQGGSAITSYRVYRGTAPGAETFYMALPASSLRMTDTAVTPGTTYFYQVSAVNAGGEGPRSGEASATPLPDTTLPAIAISSPVNHTVLGSATVQVEGTASDNIGVAKVELSSDGTTWTQATGTTVWNGTLTLPAGTDTIYARATDTSGNVRIATVTVTVPGSAATPQGVDLILLGSLIAVVIAAAVAVAFLLMRRKRKPEPPPPPPQPPAGP